MAVELDPDLRTIAEAVLETRSDRIGKLYWNSWVKWSLDRLLSFPSPLILPAVALGGLAIFLNDGHWPFVNVGSYEIANGVKIPPLWKLRTMILNAQRLEMGVVQGQSVSQFKASGHDRRITRIGHVFRRSSFDELPQALNAALGQISYVGPRLPAMADWRNVILPNQDVMPYLGFIQLLHDKLKFGVTGFFGILGRTNLTMDNRIWLEVLYGERASLKADLRIIAMTLPAMSKGR